MRFFTISFFIFISLISQAQAQSKMRNSTSNDRMTNTRSYGDIVRQQNPSIINSVGKIEGNEVKRDQAPQSALKAGRKEQENEYREGDPIDDSFLDEDPNKKGFQEF